MNCDGLANMYLVVDSFARRLRDWQILQLDEVPLLGIIKGDAIPLRNPISALLLPGLETEEEFWKKNFFTHHLSLLKHKILDPFYGIQQSYFQLDKQYGASFSFNFLSIHCLITVAVK